jgi:hypothetical protein
MTTPALLYSFFLASVLGTGFHFWKGGGGGRLAANLILSWLGFTIGHLLATSWGIHLLPIGPVQAGPGGLVSLGLLFIGEWFHQIDQS